MSEFLNRVWSYSFFLSVTFSLLLTLNFASWSVATKAFDEGYTIAEKEFKPDSPEPSINFSHQGEGTYQILSRVYATLGLGALGILFVSGLQRLVKNVGYYRLLGTASIVLLLLIFWELNWLSLLKDPNWNESLDTDFNSMVRESVQYDKISNLIVILLLCAQVVCLAITFQRKASDFRFCEEPRKIN